MPLEALLPSLQVGQPLAPIGPQNGSAGDADGQYDHIEYIAHTTPPVTTGYPDGEGVSWYQPTWLCTRDQMAVFVARALLGLE